MLKVIYRLKLGQDEFELQAEVKDEKEFFETMSFYSSLPKTAPNGSTDLKLVFRTTKKGHKYYSLVSESEKKEFKLGQNLEANGGGLFPKGWDDLYQGEDSQQDEGQSDQTVIGAPQTIATPTVVTTPKPAAKAAPKAAVAAPIVTQTAVPTPAVTTPAPAPAQAAPTTLAKNPNVTATANNVLARFGINK